MALIEVRGLSKKFGNQSILNGVDLDIRKGEFLTLIGASASGKSVLIKLIIGLMPIDRGTIRFEDRDIAKLKESDWTSVRKRMGIMFQASALFDSLSVFDNVAYGLREHRLLSEPDIEQRVSESLAQVSLPGIEHMAPGSLSGGMRKRVALARAIAMRPEILFYDEPTEGLDPINVTRVNRLMLTLRDKLHITTVVVTHNMHSAFGVSDRIAFLHEGKIAHEGEPAELKRLKDDDLAPFVRSAQHIPAAIRRLRQQTLSGALR